MASNYPTDFTAILSFGQPYGKTVVWVDQNGNPISLVGKEVIWTVQTPAGRIVKYPPLVDTATSTIGLSLSADEINTLFPFFTSEASESPFSSQTPSASLTPFIGELGTRFQTNNTGGWVTGARYYRVGTETFTSRKMTLWDQSGNRVSSFTTTGESGSGWFNITFPTWLYVPPGGLFTVSVNGNGQNSPFIFPTPSVSSTHISSILSVYVSNIDTFPVPTGSAFYNCDAVFEPVPTMESAGHSLVGTHKLLVRDSTGEGRVIKGNVILDNALPEDSIYFGEGVDVQVFAGAGSWTWTKPANAVLVSVQLVGGGGGGGSGRRGAAASIRGGGDGGTGGAYTRHIFRASDVGSTENVVVGAGGAGGIAQTVDNTAGNPGTAGGNTTFGVNKLIAYGGPGGGGGVNGAGQRTGRSIGTHGGVQGAATGNSVTLFDGVFTNTSTTGGASGGAGGGWIDGANAVQPAGSGLAHWNGVAAGAAAGVSGGAGPGNGESNGFTPGGGGGGGASTAGIAGQIGGNGGTYGGGGGGGGGCTNPNTSGAGGNGANGLVVVFTLLSTS